MGFKSRQYGSRQYSLRRMAIQSVFAMALFIYLQKKWTRGTGIQPSTSPKRPALYLYEMNEKLVAKPMTGQYSLAAVIYERVSKDPRRVMDHALADLYIVPLDFHRYRQESQRLPYPQNEEYVCSMIEEAQAIVEKATAGRARRDLLDHVIPIARVSSSLYYEFGKSCPTTFEWLMRSMQWLTIEAPWTVDTKTQLAHVDVRGHAKDTPELPYGFNSMHTVPYPSGLRFESRNQVELLREYQKTRTRTALVSQTLGPHSRPGSTLRDVLRAECEKRGPTICYTDWQGERRKAPRINPRAPATLDGQLANFEGHLAHVVPHLPLYSKGTFCVHPFGTTPTRGAIYHCLLAGGIPVIFEPYILEALSPLFTPESPFSGWDMFGFMKPRTPSWAVVFDLNDALRDPKAIYDHLAQIPQSQVDAMRAVIAEAVPKFQYALPDAEVYDDAFEYAIRTCYRYISAHRSSKSARSFA